jgi:hypothetical protein
LLSEENLHCKSAFSASLGGEAWKALALRGRKKEEKGSFSRSKRKEKEGFAQNAKEGDLALIAGLIAHPVANGRNVVPF